jgi:hypothetical protein
VVEITRIFAQFTHTHTFCSKCKVIILIFTLQRSGNRDRQISCTPCLKNPKNLYWKTKRTNFFERGRKKWALFLIAQVRIWRQSAPECLQTYKVSNLHASAICQKQKPSSDVAEVSEARRRSSRRVQMARANIVIKDEIFWQNYFMHSHFRFAIFLVGLKFFIIEVG